MSKFIHLWCLSSLGCWASFWMMLIHRESVLFYVPLLPFTLAMITLIVCGFVSMMAIVVFGFNEPNPPSPPPQDAITPYSDWEL